MENNQELIQEVKEYISKINSAMENVIEEVRDGDLNNFIDVIEGLSFCIKPIMTIENINIDVAYFQEKISEILEGIENQDYSLVADIMEYEILEMVQDLNNKLQNI